MKRKKISLISLILVLMVLFMGCEHTNGIESYICHDGDYSRIIMTGVKSEKTDFKTDEITLDFYYGYDSNSSSYLTGYNGEEGEIVGIGIYFCNAVDFDVILYDYIKENHKFSFQDYSHIDGLRFVKFIDKDEYSSNEYNVQSSMFQKPIFNYKETFTIPSDIVTSDAQSRSLRGTYFCFVVAAIAYDKSQEIYNMVTSHYMTNVLAIKYEFLDIDSVHLSDVRSML